MLPTTQTRSHELVERAYFITELLKLDFDADAMAILSAPTVLLTYRSDFA